jgi:hypothetical protein
MYLLIHVYVDTVRAGTCTLAGVNKDVMINACTTLLAGDQCSLSCPAGFQAAGTVGVTCPDAGGAVDVSGFTCTCVPSMGLAQPDVYQSRRSLILGLARTHGSAMHKTAA